MANKKRNRRLPFATEVMIRCRPYQLSREVYNQLAAFDRIAREAESFGLHEAAVAIRAGALKATLKLAGRTIKRKQ